MSSSVVIYYSNVRQQHVKLQHAPGLNPMFPRPGSYSTSNVSLEMVIWVWGLDTHRISLDTRSDGYGYGDDFLPMGDTRTWLELRQVWDGYFFSPTGNLIGTRYFTTAIILGCEQVKMCSFCYINYDLFWLLNFATLLSQIFVEY
jgi:hypothetical protein